MSTCSTSIVDAVKGTSFKYTYLSGGTAATSTASATSGTLLTTGFPIAATGAYLPPSGQTYSQTNAGGTTTSLSLKLFSVLDMVSDATVAGPSRYDSSITGYWTATNSAALTDNQVTALMTKFTTTNVPGSSPAYKMITPSSEMSAAVQSGAVANSKTSVSYDLLYSLNYEYCYWVKVYRVILGDYMLTTNSPAGTPASFTAANKTEQQRKLINQLNAINLRLVDITAITTKIATTQTAALATMNASVNSFLTNIQGNTERLNTQGAELSSADVQSKLRSRMLDYSEEKNAYANQLLSLYGFANLIALGLLFYIYKS
jgi:hypothetical protein